MSPTYQAQENSNVSIRWDSETSADLSLSNLVCLFQSEPLRVLYEMINGVENPNTQHRQFAGRVQVDRDALRDGTVRLQLSNVSAQDSGLYWCDLAAHYNRILVNSKSVQSRIAAVTMATNLFRSPSSEKFILNVSRTSDGDNSGSEPHEGERRESY